MDPKISWKLRENKNSSSAKYKTNRSRANVLRYLPVFALSFQSLLCTISRRAFSFCVLFFHFFHLDIRTNDRIFSLNSDSRGHFCSNTFFLIFCLAHDHCHGCNHSWTMDGKIVDWRTCIDGENKVSYFLLACFLRILHHIWSINQSSFFLSLFDSYFFHSAHQTQHRFNHKSAAFTFWFFKRLCFFSSSFSSSSMHHHKEHPKWIRLDAPLL